MDEGERTFRLKLTLRQMQVFDAVARHGSVVTAAEVLHMTQGAASSALKDMQVILGRALFVHVRGRHLQMTEEGKRLRSRIRCLLREIEDIERAPQATLEGELVVGAAGIIAETVLPELCVKFREPYPGVRLIIRTESTGELYQKMQHLELETALIEHLPDMHDIELTRWRNDELWLVIAPGHPLARRTHLKIGDLRDVSWCSHENHASITVRLRVLLHQELGSVVPIGIETPSNQAIRLAAMAGSAAR